METALPRKTTRHLRQKGLTLIETIIYLGLLCALVASLALLFDNLVKSGAANMKRAELSGEAEFVFQKVQWLLSGIARAEVVEAGERLVVSGERNWCISTGTSGKTIAVFWNDDCIGPSDPLVSGRISASGLSFEKKDTARASSIRMNMILNGSAFSSVIILP